MRTPDHSYRKFRQFYDAYFDKIYAYLYFRSGRNRDLAEDLTSEVFLKALERFTTFNTTESFSAWIYAIARNHLIDHYRVSRTHVPLEDVEDILSIDTKNLGAEIDQKAEVQRVLATIKTLPENYNEILTLKYVSDLSNEEIGAITQKSPGNVRVLLHRALTALKEQLH